MIRHDHQRVHCLTGAFKEYQRINNHLADCFVGEQAGALALIRHLFRTNPLPALKSPPVVRETGGEFTMLLQVFFDSFIPCLNFALHGFPDGLGAGVSLPKSEEIAGAILSPVREVSGVDMKGFMLIEIEDVLRHANRVVADGWVPPHGVFHGLVA